jgi:hypothetical protein
MNASKKITLFGLTGIFLLIAAIGCEDALLNQKPRGELTMASFFETEEHAIEATNATYERLRSFNFTNFLWLGMTDIASDDANKGSTPGDGPMQRALDEWTFDPSTLNFINVWNDYYVGVYRANLAIANIPPIEMDENLKQRLIAENKFLRAYFYFFLVRAYGGVPLILEPQEPGEFQVPRASAEEVFTQIEQDLQDAIADLPLKSEYSVSDLGRITKGAARGMLAKPHLDQDEYEAAEQRAREVIDSGEYSLYSDYEEIFRPDGENSSDSIFEVQAVAVLPAQGGTQYSVHQGVRGTPNLGWGFNNPSNDLLSAYEPGDPRLGSTVLFVHETLPYGPEDVVRHNTGMPDNQRYNQKPFVPLDHPGGAGNGGSNQRILRYADVLLVAAEAAYQNGNEADALAWVNDVRERARDGQSATIGIDPEAISSIVADTLGDPALEGQPFARYVTSGGPADNAGIQAMQWTNPAETNGILVFDNVDIIQSVDGVDVSSVAEYRSEMSEKIPGQPVSFSIMRITESEGTPKTRTTQNINFTITTQALLPDITVSGQNLLEAIWHERRVELAMEQHRMWDIRRTGRAGEVLRALGKDFTDGKHELYPIPEDEIQINPELTQNPNY